MPPIPGVDAPGSGGSGGDSDSGGDSSSSGSTDEDRQTSRSSGGSNTVGGGGGGPRVSRPDNDSTPDDSSSSGGDNTVGGGGGGPQATPQDGGETRTPVTEDEDTGMTSSAGGGRGPRFDDQSRGELATQQQVESQRRPGLRDQETAVASTAGGGRGPRYDDQSRGEVTRSDAFDRMDKAQEDYAEGVAASDRQLYEEAAEQEQFGDRNWTQTVVDTGSPFLQGLGLVEDTPDNIQGDPFEDAIDNRTAAIAAGLEERGAQFEARTDELADQKGGPAMAGVGTSGAGDRIAAELGEAIYTTGADVVRLPSAALEAAEGAEYLAEGYQFDGDAEDVFQANMRAVAPALERAGVDVDRSALEETTIEQSEYERRLDMGAQLSEEAGAAMAKDIRENPEDFAAELAIGVAAGAATGGAARAARSGRLTPSRPSMPSTGRAGRSLPGRPDLGRAPDVTIRRDPTSGPLDVDPMLKQQIRGTTGSVTDAPQRAASRVTSRAREGIDSVPDVPSLDEVRGGLESRVTRARQANRNTFDSWRDSLEPPSTPSADIPTADQIRGGLESRVTRARQANRNTVEMWMDSAELPDAPSVDVDVPSLDEVRGGLESRVTRARQANRNTFDMWRESLDTPSRPDVDVDVDVPSLDEVRGGLESRVTRARQANRNTFDAWRESLEPPSGPDVTVPSTDEIRGGLESRVTRARQANRNTVDLYASSAAERVRGAGRASRQRLSDASDLTVRVGPARPPRQPDFDIDLGDSADDVDLGPFADDSLSDGDFLGEGDAGSASVSDDVDVSSGGGQRVIQRRGDRSAVDLEPPGAPGRSPIDIDTPDRSPLVEGVAGSATTVVAGSARDTFGSDVQGPTFDAAEYSAPTLDIGSAADLGIGADVGESQIAGPTAGEGTGVGQPTDLDQPVTTDLTQPPELATTTQPVPGTEGPPRRPRAGVALDFGADDDGPQQAAGDGSERRYEYGARGEL